MLFDTARVSAYRDAIKEVIKPGAVVADLGSGTGLLTFMCLQQGAARVHAIERSDVISCAQELAHRNGFESKITFHKCDARDVVLTERVDVIVSELMGHLAFEEGMAETISAAKEKILKPHGVSIPSSVVLRSSLVSQREIFQNCIDIWRDVEGVDFSPIRQKALNCAYVTDISFKDLLSEPQTLCEWNFSTGVDDIAKKVRFQPWRDGEANGVALWFDAALTSSIRLSSGPWSKTHWQQCFIPFSKPLQLAAGNSIEIEISIGFQRRQGVPFSFSLTVV